MPVKVNDKRTNAIRSAPLRQAASCASSSHPSTESVSGGDTPVDSHPPQQDAYLNLCSEWLQSTIPLQPSNMPPAWWSFFSTNVLEYTKSIVSSECMALIPSICREDGEKTLANMYSVGLYVTSLRERLLMDLKFGFGTGRDCREGDIKKRLRPNPRKRRFPDMIKQKSKPTTSKKMASLLLKSSIAKRKSLQQSGGGGGLNSRKKTKSEDKSALLQSSLHSKSGDSAVPYKRKKYQSSTSSVGQDEEELLQQQQMLKVKGSGTSKHGRPLRGQGVDKKVLDWKFCYDTKKESTGVTAAASAKLLKSKSGGGGSEGGGTENKLKSPGASPMKGSSSLSALLSGHKAGGSLDASAGSSSLTLQQQPGSKVLAVLRKKGNLKRPLAAGGANSASSSVRDKVRNYLMMKQNTEGTSGGGGGAGESSAGGAAGGKNKKAPGANTVPAFVPPSVKEVLKGIHFRVIVSYSEKGFWIRGMPRKDFTIFSSRYGNGKSCNCDILQLEVHEDQLCFYDVLLEPRSNVHEPLTTSGNASSAAAPRRPNWMAPSHDAAQQAGGEVVGKKAPDASAGSGTKPSAEGKGHKGMGGDLSSRGGQHQHHHATQGIRHSATDELDNVEDPDNLYVGRDVVVESSGPSTTSSVGSGNAPMLIQNSTLPHGSQGGGGYHNHHLQQQGASSMKQQQSGEGHFVPPTANDIMATRFRRPLPPPSMKQVRRVYTKNPTCPAILNRNRRKSSIPSPMATHSLGFAFNNPQNGNFVSNVRAAQAPLASTASGKADSSHPGMVPRSSLSAAGVGGGAAEVTTAAGVGHQQQQPPHHPGGNIIRPPFSAAQPWLLSPSLRTQMLHQHAAASPGGNGGAASGQLISGGAGMPRMIPGQSTMNSVNLPRAGFPGVVGGIATGHLQPPQASLLPSAYNLQTQRRGTWQVSKPTKVNPKPAEVTAPANQAHQ